MRRSEFSDAGEERRDVRERQERIDNRLDEFCSFIHGPNEKGLAVNMLVVFFSLAKDELRE